MDRQRRTLRVDTRNRISIPPAWLKWLAIDASREVDAAVYPDDNSIVLRPRNLAG